jgi:hypothetical protein
VHGGLARFLGGLGCGNVAGQAFQVVFGLGGERVEDHVPHLVLVGERYPHQVAARAEPADQLARRADSLPPVDKVHPAVGP